MNTNKLTRIGCITLGVLGVISLFLVFITGDDAIKLYRLKYVNSKRVSSWNRVERRNTDV